MNYCSMASNTSRSGHAVCPICVVLSSLFAPVLGHWRDTDERVFGATRRHPAAVRAPHPRSRSCSGVLVHWVHRLAASPSRSRRFRFRQTQRWRNRRSSGRLATSHRNRNAPAWPGRFFAAPKCQFRKGREQSGSYGDSDISLLPSWHVAGLAASPGLLRRAPCRLRGCRSITFGGVRANLLAFINDTEPHCEGARPANSDALRPGYRADIHREFVNLGFLQGERQTSDSCLRKDEIRGSQNSVPEWPSAPSAPRGAEPPILGPDRPGSVRN